MRTVPFEILGRMPHSFAVGHPTISGFSTIEILIAFAVGITFISAAIMVTFSDSSLKTQISLESGNTSALDVSLDQSGLYRTMKKIGDSTKMLLTDWYAPLVTASETMGAVGYTMTPSVTDISPCMKLLTEQTVWTSINDRDRQISFGTALSNIDIAQAMSTSGCDPFPPDAWDSPKKISSTISVPDITAHDIIVTHNAGRRIVIIGTTAPDPAKDDLYLYDLTDPNNPSLVLGSIDTGLGINAITIQGAYIFALQNDGSNQLQIIRIFDESKPITDPAYYTPTLVTQISLHNVAGAYPEGRSIAYYNNYLYIGTWNNNFPTYSPEFLIYNVFDPTNPTFVGEYNLKHSVNSIAIQGAYAYLATTDNSGELTLMHIEDPTTPTIAGTYDTPASSIDAEEVYVLGNKAYIGLNRRTGGASEFLIIDISDSSHPTELGGVSLGLTSNTYVTGLYVQGHNAFVSTNANASAFRVLDVSDPTHPTLVQCSPYTDTSKINDLQYLDGFVFLASNTAETISTLYDTHGNICN